MITETILNRFKNNILNENLHLPHGTKSAKVICHVDLDGVASGITMVQQLIKQGIPKNRITVEFAQYGDEDKDKGFTDRFKNKKNQYVGVTDFAKLPKVKPYKIWNSLLNFNVSKDDKKQLVDYLERYNFKNVDQERFNRTILKSKNIEKNKFTDKHLKELLDAFKAFTDMKEYSRKNKTFKVDKPTIENIETFSFPLISPQFVSDHHSNDTGALSPGKTGEIATGSPSEAEFLANKYANGMWSQADLKAISAVDSAKYTEKELRDSMFIVKKFTGKDRQKNLAVIISCIYDGLCKKDRNAAAWIVKNAQPSLVSLYTTTLKAAGYVGKRLEYVEALKNGDVKKAESLLTEIPSELNKRYDRRGEPTKEVNTLDGLREKNKKDIADMKTGYIPKSEKDKKLESIKGKRDADSKAIRDEIKSKKGKLRAERNFAIFDGTVSKTQYSRYANAFYSENGQRQPFGMRYWSDFFQISKSPLYKGEVDFSKVNEHVLEDIRNFLVSKNVNSFKIKSVMEEMKEKNGGHKGGIWSFQGFKKITAPSKITEPYYKAKNLHAKNKDLEIANKVLDKENKVGKTMEEYEKIKKECMYKAMNSAINWTNKLYPPSQEALDKLKTNDDTFDYKRDK